jgi:hypothetical protein
VLHCGACFHICQQSCSGERRCNAGVCTEPQKMTVALADPTTGCVVAWDERYAFSQSEADACVQGFYPNLKAGAPTGPYNFQAWCRGSLCEDWLRVPGLSQGDAQKCIESYRPPPYCTVSPGPCTNCGFLSNCGGKCVDRATDATHCGFCDNACPANTKCVNGWCV